MALAFSRLNKRLHDRDSFACGVDALDIYLRHHAGQHQRGGIATTHVLIDDTNPSRILGYCSLAAAQLHLQELLEKDRKKLPSYPVPAMRVGRLAVEKTEHGKGYGQRLLGYVIDLALLVRDVMGVRALVVDAKDEQAAAFYEAFGFQRCMSGALTLYLPILQ